MFFGGIFLVTTGLSLVGSLGITVCFALLLVLVYIFTLKKVPILLLCGILAGFVSWFFIHDYSPSGSSIEQWSTIQGTIEKKTKIGQYEVFIQNELYLAAIEKEYNSGDKVDILVSRVISSEERKINIWKPLLHGVFTREFDYPLRMAMKGLRGMIYTKDTLLLEESVGGLRNTITNKIHSIYEGSIQGGLLQGMIIGGRAGLPEETYDTFIKSGLVHIIAVSGSNIALLVLLIECLFFRVPLFVRRRIVLASIVVYVSICGLDSSLLRAALMGGLIVLCGLYGKRGIALRGLQYAATLLIVMNPYMLWYDLGFLLSVMSLLGIYCVSYFAPHNKIKRIIYTFFCIPIGAGAAALPVIYIFIGTASLQSFLVNILVTPLVGPSLLTGLGSLVINWKPLTVLSYKLLGAIITLSRQFGTTGLTVNNDSAFQTTTIIVCLVVAIRVVMVIPKQLSTKSSSNLQSFT